MALLTAQTVSAPGLTPTFTAVTATDTIPADTAVLWLYVKNGGAGADAVTITDPGRTPAGSAAVNPTVSVAAGTDRIIPIYAAYVNSATQVISIAHSVTTSVTCAVLRVA